MGFRSRMKGHALDVGDTLLDKGAQNIQKVAGVMEGHHAYATAYGNLKTTHARHMSDEKALGKGARKLGKARRHLLKTYSSESLSKTVERFGDHPEKMQKKIRQKAEKLGEDLQAFIEGFEECLKAVNDIASVELQEISQNEGHMIGLMTKYAKFVKEKGVIAPHPVLEQLRQAFDHESHDQIHIAEQDAREDNKVEQHDGESQNIFGKMSHGKYYINKLKSNLKKSEKKNNEMYKKRLKQLETDLEQGSADISWLFRFREVIEGFDHLAKYHRDITHDILEIIGQLETDYQPVIKCVQEAIGFFQGSSNVNEIQEELKKLHEDFESSKQVLEREKEGERIIKVQAEKAMNNAHRIIALIEQYSKSNLENATHAQQPLAA